QSIFCTVRLPCFIKFREAASLILGMRRIVADNQEFISLLDVYSILNTKMAEAGGNNAFARQHGLNKTYVSNMANDRRKLSDDLLDALGLERVEAFRVKAPAQTRKGKK
ncbi:hypothetical protein, partial [Acetobacter cerevisiae]